MYAIEFQGILSSVLSVYVIQDRFRTYFLFLTTRTFFLAVLRCFLRCPSLTLVAHCGKENTLYCITFLLCIDSFLYCDSCPIIWLACIYLMYISVSIFPCTVNVAIKYLNYFTWFMVLLFIVIFRLCVSIPITITCFLYAYSPAMFFTFLIHKY